MEIKELHVKNFGKFSDRHFYMEDGIHIFYGENEYGKSTLYAFIKAMLFGMERGRGRAALNDDFSRYQPWENPNYYAGVMRFISGGKCFRLERSFDRYARGASLVCEDDGEELSVADGDLEVLLGGLTKDSFENTVAIGQLMARPGQGLAEELKNYAANYYETGGSNVDLSRALEHLRTQRKTVEQEIKELLNKQEIKKESVRQECNYIAKDLEKLTIEIDENHKKLSSLNADAKQIETEKKEAAKRAGADADFGEGAQEGETGNDNEAVKGKSYLSIGVLGVAAGAMGRLWSAFTSSKSILSGGAVISVLSWLFLIIGAILIVAGVRKRINRHGSGAARNSSGELGGAEKGFQQDSSAAKGEAQAGQADQGDLLHKLRWEGQRIKGEYKEKQVRFQNLQEQLAEMEMPGERLKNLRFRSQALVLAEERMMEASKNMVQGFGDILNRKASHILEQITQGRYSTLLVDEQLNMTLLKDGIRISVDRVSCGTIEQVYFAIRMAAAEILYEEPLPVIFDDAFALYDEKRLKSTLKWLREQPRQVIIFTCQKREQEIAEQF